MVDSFYDNDFLFCDQLFFLTCITFETEQTDDGITQLLYCSFTQQSNKNQYGTPILYLLFCIQSNQKV